MTDRIQGFIVTLDRDIREDDVEPVLNAIRMIQHVVDVAPVVTHHEDHCARVRVRTEMQSAIQSKSCAQSRSKG